MVKRLARVFLAGLSGRLPGAPGSTWADMRASMLLFFLCMAIIPIGFGAVVIRGGSPVTPELYGELVYSIPALVWVAAQFLLTAAAAIGAAFNLPRVCAAGSLGLSGLLGFFSMAAIAAGATGTLTVFASLAASAICLAYSATAWWGR